VKLLDAEGVLGEQFDRERLFVARAACPPHTTK
jgi:hypothetical protein